MADAAQPVRSGAPHAVLAGFLGWTLDAFDFFIVAFVLAPIAKEFGTSIPALALTITASLATRWIGAILFGLLADRHGRRIPLIVNILYFFLIEVVSGLLQEGYALGFLLAAGVYRVVYPHWGWRPLFFIGGLPALLTLFVRAKVKEPEAWRRSRTDWTTY